jgi:hypothetical protein
MAMLVGQYRLRILNVHRNPNRYTTRYTVTIISCEPGATARLVGHEVTVKFTNGGPDPIGRIGDFNGDENDIRDAGDPIDQHRKNKSFHNPFI